MTLSETLQQKLADWKPADPGRHSLSALDETTGWGVAVTADQCDLLSCRVWELILRRAEAPASDLAGWANRVADRVTGLLEPLRVVEVDTLRQEAQVRSSEPSHRLDQLFYYEILIRAAGEVVVRRYQGAQAGQRREQVAFALTHEALVKLVADLVA